MLLEILTLLGAQKEQLQVTGFEFLQLVSEMEKGNFIQKGEKEWKSYRLTFKRQKNLTTSIRAEPTNIQTRAIQVCNWEF